MKVFKLLRAPLTGQFIKLILFMFSNFSFAFQTLKSHLYIYLTQKFFNF